MKLPSSEALTYETHDNIFTVTNRLMKFADLIPTAVGVFHPLHYHSAPGDFADSYGFCVSPRETRASEVRTSQDVIILSRSGYLGEFLYSVFEDHW